MFSCGRDELPRSELLEADAREFAELAAVRFQ
jgi:hypothetical protein